MSRMRIVSLGLLVLTAAVLTLAAFKDGGSASVNLLGLRVTAKTWMVYLAFVLDGMIIASLFK